MRYRTGCPDYSRLPPQKYDWDPTPHGNVREEVPADAPEPLGKRVITTTFVDANLYHDYLTGRAVTATMHLANQTIVDTYTKKQNTVETSTYGLEFVAAARRLNKSLTYVSHFAISASPFTARLCLATTNRLSPAARFPIHN